MKFIVVLIVILESFSAVRAQIPEFDKLEMLYAQNHYKMVYRKANRLLDIPDYDFSQIPKFYKALSLFQLSQNDHWLIRNPNALEDAAKMFNEIKRSSDGKKVFNAHMYEISFLKHDLISWAEDLKRRGQKEDFERLQKAMTGLFDDVPDFEYQTGNTNQFATTNSDAELDMYAKERLEIVEYAKKYIGTPYVWSGNDPNGFDCSGFTSYVMKNFKKDLPRRAVDQYESSHQLKEKNVMMGDLVFFDNGSGISHVGMIISEKGKPLVMIHASSSKGVVITEIEKSDYWLKRLYGFGTYVYK
jgi:cell wall-associated NlpC family hydrolase